MGKMYRKKPRGVGVRRIKTLSITFSLVMLEFFVRMIYNNCYSVCACSSVDRAPASGAGCVGSIPVRRTKSTSLHCGEVLFLSCSNYFPYSKISPRQNFRMLMRFSMFIYKSVRAQTAQALSLRIRLADFRIIIYVQQARTIRHPSEKNTGGIIRTLFI